MSNFDKLKSLLKPGDVINNDGGRFIWYQPWTGVLNWAIQQYQKDLFGKESDYAPTHTLLYFSPEQIFSMTTPKGKWETLEERCQSGFTVFHYTKHAYSERHLEIMYQTASELVG